MFEQSLALRSKTLQRSIAFPESRDPRILHAASYLAQSASVKAVYLFISRSELDQFKGLDFYEELVKNERMKYVDEEFLDLQQLTYESLEEIYHRKKKHISCDELKQKSFDPLYQAGTLLHRSKIDAALAGAVRTTADVIRAALPTVGLSPNCSTVSGSFIMTKQTQSSETFFIFTDCGVLIDPSDTQLAEMAWESVKIWQSLNMPDEPKVAFLSFSTRGSADHPSCAKMISANKMFQKSYPRVISDGELQFDAAVDLDVCMRKAPGSRLAGDANILVFPNLDAGNLAYKIAQRLGGFCAYGPILQGLARPYSDLSRGASVKDIVVSSYINVCRV